MTAKDWAVRYVEGGMAVLALHGVAEGRCTCGRPCTSAGKHPRADLHPRGVHDAVRSVEEVARWPDGVNVGVALGATSAGLMAFDVDDADTAALLLHPELSLSDQTAVVRTPHGCHVYFRVTGSTRTFHVRSGGVRIGEVRGDGAYVVAPPSTTPHGAYRWLGAWETRLPHVEVVPDAWAYVSSVLASVGVRADPPARGTGPTLRPLSPGGIGERDLPPDLARDFRLAEARSVFAGSVAQVDDPDRSGRLYALAHALVEVSASIGRGVDAIEVAGILKRFDRLAFARPKYLGRPDADRYYLAMAEEAVRHHASAGEAGGSGPSPPSGPGAGELPNVDAGLDVGGELGPSEPGEYLWDGEYLVYRPSSRAAARRVANFHPEILEDIEVDYGGDEPRRRAWRVRLSLASGQSRTLVLSGRDLASSAGLEEALSRECSSQYRVEPGMYGRLKNALASFGRGARHVRVFACTGWVEHGGRWYYLLPGLQGAIASDGVDPSFSIDRDRLPRGSVVSSHSLSAYGRRMRPPASGEEATAAWEAFRRLIECGPVEVTLPTVLQVMAGPLASEIERAGCAIPCVHLMGRTGAFKTSYALCALSLFGAFVVPPATWSSTANYLESLMHAARDLTLMVDDYKRAYASRQDVLRVLQNYSDRTARGRMRPGGEVEAALVPRCLLLTTGEDFWEAEASAEARTIVVTVGVGDIDPARLTAVQEDASLGRLASFGASYLRWLASTKETGSLDLASFAERWRSHLADLSSGQRVHARLVASLATLLSVGFAVRLFVHDAYGPEARRWLDVALRQCVLDLVAGLLRRAQEVEESSPVQLLLDVLRQQLYAGRAYLVGGPQRPGGQAVGYLLRTGEVLLTRSLTMAWYEAEMRRRGAEVPFTWSAILQCAGEAGGRRADRVRLAGRGSPQLSGVLFEADVLGLTRGGDEGVSV